MLQDSDDEEEHFVDAPDEEEDASAGPSAGSEEVQVALKTKGVPTVSSWVHRTNTGAGESLQPS